MNDTPSANQGVPGNIGNTSVVLLMVRDAYANYVVQTTLDVVPESEEKRLLLEELNEHSEELVSCLPLYLSRLGDHNLSLLFSTFRYAAQLHICKAHSD